MGNCFIYCSFLVKYAFFLQTVHDGKNFFENFSFFTDPDPTKGYVQYVDADSSWSSGIGLVREDHKVWLGVDNVTVLDPAHNNHGDTGRKSVRLESRFTFDGHVMVVDFEHIPTNACGTWPAFWTYNYGEDPYAEIDILEGVNNQMHDEISLHTSSACSLKDDPSIQYGTKIRTDCSMKTNPVDGCGVSGPPGSYGESFNAKGGGYWVLFLTPDELSVWMFSRNSAPVDFNSADRVWPPHWKHTPLLQLKSHDGCRIDQQWTNQTIIFNTNFCGENAGGKNWQESNCPEMTGYSTCEAYVAANPDAFSGSYFLINWVKTYVVGYQWWEGDDTGIKFCKYSDMKDKSSSTADLNRPGYLLGLMILWAIVWKLSLI